MKRIGVRMYTFQQLMNRLDSDFWCVRKVGNESYMFMPVQYTGREGR